MDLQITTTKSSYLNSIIVSPPAVSFLSLSEVNLPVKIINVLFVSHRPTCQKISCFNILILVPNNARASSMQ
jgi:hypothetical protein